MSNKKILSLVIVVFLTLATLGPLFAGGTQEGSAEGQAAEESATLTVYTYDVFPEAMEEAIIEHFSTNYGVDVTVQRFEDTGGLYNQIYLERDNPEGDVMIGLDNTYLGSIIEHKLLQPYKPQDLQLVDQGLVVDPEFRAVPFDFGQILLNYNAEMLPNPPGSWEELLDPALEDSIIMMNPGTSSPGRNFLLFTVAEFGQDGYLDFWQRLKPNILTVTSGWSEGYGLYTEGEAPIVLSYDTSPAYHILYEDETKYRTLDIGNKAYAQIEVAGILQGTENRENAKRFMDYIVSAEFQSLIPENQIMYPIHPEAELPEAFRAVDRAEKIVNMDEARVAENFDTWLREWEQVMR